MRLLQRTIVLVVLSLITVAAFAGDEFTGRVVAVLDGDTIDVLVGQSTTRIRLNGIDCPEKGQAFGTRAKQFTAKLAFGKEVKVSFLGVDRYGRTIGDVVLPDGRILNRELVKAGFAWWFRRYAPKDRELEKLESEAREARRGLWVDADPIPPWEFRRLSRSRR